MSSAQQQNELLEKEIKKKKSKYYDIIHFPPNWGLEKKMGFKIKGDHIKFIGVFKRVEKMLNVKGEEFEVRDVASMFTLDAFASAGFGIENNSFANPDNAFRKMGMTIAGAPGYSSGWDTLRMIFISVAPGKNFEFEDDLSHLSI